jgi:transcriptional regulator
MSPTPTLLKGTLDLLVLKALSWESMHGYDIIEWVRRETSGQVEIDDAALYQALHRLEDRGCLRSEWGLSDNNRRAKYYELTALGRKEFAAESASWREYAQFVFTLLEAKRPR